MGEKLQALVQLLPSLWLPWYIGANRPYFGGTVPIFYVQNSTILSPNLVILHIFNLKFDIFLECPYFRLKIPLFHGFCPFFLLRQVGTYAGPPPMTLSPVNFV